MNGKRGVSVGSILMLSMTAVVLALFVILILPLRGTPRDPVEAPRQTAAPTPAATTRVRAVASPTPAAGQTAPPVRSMTLTAGGTVAVEDGIRDSGRYREAGTYDYSDVLTLLRDDFAADLSLVTLENLVVSGANVNKLVAPEQVMPMLQRAGIDTVAIGFRRCFEHGAAGVGSTQEAASRAGLRTIGAYSEETQAAPEAHIREINGIRVALLHFTQTLSDASRNKLRRDGRSVLVPLASQAGDAIRAVREAGAEVVIVSVHWGSVGNASPIRAQRTIAQAMADAGADVIIGTGSRVVQTAEWITAAEPNGGERRTLCCWSLGCLLSDSRDNSRVAGMLLHLTIEVDPQHRVTITDASYTPTFVWRYTVSSATRYQVVSALRDPPDMMNSDQRTALSRAGVRVENKLNGSALRERLR